MPPRDFTTPFTLDPIEDITRRRLLTALPGLGLIAAGVACGSDDDDQEDEVAPTTAATEPPTTRSVDTPLGPVDVPLRPERIVVFDRRGTLAYLLDLGVVPVGAMSAASIYGTTFHPLLSGTDEIEPMDWQSPDLEQVAAMQPDLIVGFQSDVEPVYDQLTGIAPTVAIAIGLYNPQDELLDLGRILGMEEQAEALIAEFEAEVAAAADAIEVAGTASIILPLEDGIRVYDGEDMAGQILQDLGQTITPDITTLGAAPGDGIALVSFEQASVIDGDTIVLLVNLSADQDAIKQNLYEMPVFQALPAVQAERIVEIESQANFGTAGLAGQRQILEALVEAFS